jgi:hypothetical protein
VRVPYVIANLRSPAKFEQVVTAKSTMHPNSTYVVLSTIDIDGLSLTHSKSGLLKETQRYFELLHCGYVAQWEAFRGAVISQQLFAHDDTSLTRQLFFFTRFTAADYGPVWMLINGCINYNVQGRLMIYAWVFRHPQPALLARA